MAEKVRKRKSKWDVVAETHNATEIGQYNVLPVEVDAFVKEQGSNSDGNSSHSNCSAIPADNSLLYKDSSDAYQSSKLCGLEEVRTEVAENCLGVSQFRECSDMEAGDTDGSKIACWGPMPGNQTTTDVGKMSHSPKHLYVKADDDIDASKRSQWEPISGNPTTANDGNMSLSPKHPDVEADVKDGSKPLHWGPITGHQTIKKYSSSADGWENQTTEKAGSEIDGWGHRNTANDGRVGDEWGTAANSYRTSASPGLPPRRQHGPSNSPRSSWSRSHRSRSWSGSRSRSRSRSRSPFPGLKREPQRCDRGRTGARGPPCRDFAAGRCRRGSQCRFVHEDGDRNHFEIGTRDTKESRYERGRFSGYEIKGNFMDTREHRDYSRDRPSQRHGSRYDGDWEKPEQHRNNRSSRPCFDFIKGKCIRGSSCRYVHQEASSDGGWLMKDEARERSRDRRDADSSFGWRPEPHRAGKLPCKYFAEGRCSRGEGCKFSHHGLPHGSLDHGPQDGTGHISQHLQTQNPQENICHMLPQDAPQQALASQEQNIIQETSGQYPRVPAVNTQAMAENANIQQHLGSIEGENIVPNNIISQAKMDSVNSQFNVVGVPAQYFAQNGPNQCVIPQPLPVQNFAPNVQFQQFVPPLPFNGAMHQAYPPSSNGQNQFVASHVPPNTQILNASMQSQPVPTPPHNGQSQPNFNLGGQIQHNLPAVNGSNQQNYNVSAQTQNVCLPHNAHNQPSFHQIGQIQQGLTLPYNGQNQHNIDISGQSQQILPLPQGGPFQQIAHSAAPNGQNYYTPPRPVPNPQSFNSGIQGNEMISRHQANSHHQAQAGVKESVPVPVPGITEIIPPQSSTDAPIVHKVVTSEQAAQITNLSASLAHFFGNGPQLPQLYAALNPQSATGQEPLQPFLNPSAVGPPALAEAPHVQLSQESSIPDPLSDSADPEKSDTSNIPPGFSSASVEHKDPKLEESLTIMKSSAPASTIDETNDANQKNHEPKQIEVEIGGGAAPKEGNDTEIDQNKKEQTATHLEDMDTDVRANEEGKRSKDKDSKSNRMFKCALVEFVKDALKPAWKEGHLSKEVHKTIVKKVVDKVTGAMQSANIPQTQEKIDIYMEYSKVKLGKLVQAYLEKYV